MEFYKTLNDAAIHEEGLKAGDTKILFWTNLCVFKFTMIQELPRLEDLDRTHVELGSIAETDFNEIYRMLQAEFWSPHGEAKYLLRELGVHHSMTMGDIIIVGDEMRTITKDAFHLLEPEKKKKKKK